MFPLREPPLWMLGTGLVGYVLGQWKGIPRWGFLLGLVLGPLGWAIIMVWPAQAGIFKTGTGFGSAGTVSDSARNASSSAGTFFATPCPRCQRSVPRGKGACPHCGNVMVAVSYRVQASTGAEPKTK